MPAIKSGAEVAVTGANGFIGSHICKRLIDDGFRVRAVVRDASDSSKTAHLVAMGANMSCVTGSLTEAGGFDRAFAGCAAVVHTAAVVEVLDSSDAQERIVKPAVAGTKNVVASCRACASVQRLVMTSSVAAVQSPLGKPDSHVYTEADWNEWSSISTDAYGFAKTSAEREAWASLKATPAPFDASVICPSVTLGPPLTKAHTKASTVLVRELLYNNTMNNYVTSFVDVRDVAAAAVAALTTAAAGGERFIVTGDDKPMDTLALGPLLQAQLPQYKVGSAGKYGPWFIWLGAKVGLVSVFQESQFARKFVFSNAKLKEVLRVSPRPLPDTLREAAQKMIDEGWVKPKPKK